MMHIYIWEESFGVDHNITFVLGHPQKCNMYILKQMFKKEFAGDEPQMIPDMKKIIDGKEFHSVRFVPETIKTKDEFHNANKAYYYKIREYCSDEQFVKWLIDKQGFIKLEYEIV